MKFTNLQWLAERNRPASALVGLLIVIALVFLVYFVQWYLRKTAKDPDICHDLMPWKEWRLRQSSEKPQQGPSEEQVKLTESLAYDSNLRVKDGDEPRGEIRFVVKPEGSVFGEWYGMYHRGRTASFQIMAGDFEGKVYPAKIYRDENGEEDPSQLYFLAKGDFWVQGTNSEKGTIFNKNGQIYVRGWISPKRVSMGEVTITSDEKYFEIFTWKTYRPVKKTPLGL
jgi:hypothetical protein